MQYVKLFEQFINEAKSQVKFGRFTDKNIEDKAANALSILNGAIGKTITGTDLKKIEGINFFGPNPGKNLKKTSLKFIDVHALVFNDNKAIEFCLIYETKYDLNNNFVEGSEKDNPLLSTDPGWYNRDGEEWNIDMQRKSSYSYIRPLRPQDGSKVYKSTSDTMYNVLELQTPSNNKKFVKALDVLGLGDIIL